jgi:hypothetical protein
MSTESNRAREAETGTANAHDGEGRRVRKLNRAELVTYVYDVSGQLAIEYTTLKPADNAPCLGKPPGGTRCSVTRIIWGRHGW